MAKTITFNFEGTDYTLEFTRRSIETLERGGFDINDLNAKPVTTLPALFAGAFLAHHRLAKKETIDRIFARMQDKVELLEKLAQMYSEPLESLMGEPEEQAGNLSWTASF